MAEPTAPPATIKDVAAMAGVSVPTVSRFLTGAARVSDDKRARVAAAIAELRFTPNPAARALGGRAPGVVAVLAGNTSRYGYAETIRGIEEAARAADHLVTITALDGTGEADLDAALALALSQPVAGVIVLAFDPAGVAALHRLPSGVAAVALSGGRFEGRRQIVIDEDEGAFALTTHLLSLGHPTVHHVSVPAPGGEGGRTTGWRRALIAAGRPVPDIIAAGWDPAEARPLGAALAGRDDVTAVFCGNDEVAMGVIAGLRDQGLAVPRDLSVAGFDNHPLAQLWAPALTTVAQDFAELGRRGWQLLRDPDAGPRLITLTPDLIVRDSTAAPTGRPTRDR